MAITFPASPTNGQTFTSGNKTWQWDGTTWLAYGASLSPTVLKVDAANARVGVNNQSPAYALDVNGTIEGTQFLQGTDYLSPYQGFRNKVINGNMSVWQRGTSVAVGTLGYTADRWFHQSYNGATISRQPTSDTSVLPNVQYCARVQRNSGVTSTNFMYFTQSMETQESIKVSGKTITLSFYARKGANFSATSNAFKAELFYGTGTDQNMILGYTGQAQLFTSTFTLTSSWVRYSVTATIPVTSTEITPLFGYTPTGTAGANDWFEITGVQLEEGSVATPFEQRPIGTELALCQRYYWRWIATSTVSYYSMIQLRGGTVFALGATLTFPATMRTTPSISINSMCCELPAGSTVALTNGAVTVVASPSSGGFYASRTGNWSADSVAILRADNTTSAYVEHSAEL